MTPQTRTAAIAVMATASSAVLFAAALAAFTDLVPSRVAAYTVAWLLACASAWLVWDGLKRGLRERDDRAARTEDGAR